MHTCWFINKKITEFYNKFYSQFFFLPKPTSISISLWNSTLLKYVYMGFQIDTCTWRWVCVFLFFIHLSKELEKAGVNLHYLCEKQKIKRHLRSWTPNTRNNKNCNENMLPEYSRRARSILHFTSAEKKSMSVSCLP